ARQHQRRFRPLQRGDLLLDRRDRRIGVARVEELLRLSLVVRAHFVRVFEDERRGFVDRGGEGFGAPVDAFPADQFSGWFHGLVATGYNAEGPAALPFTGWTCMRSPPAPTTGSM